MKILAKEIEMIAVFDRGGSIEPRRFRVEEPEGEEITIPVGKIVSVTEERKAGAKSLIFLCQGSISGLERQYEIKYRIEDHRWELYKM